MSTETPATDTTPVAAGETATKSKLDLAKEKALAAKVSFGSFLFPENEDFTKATDWIKENDKYVLANCHGPAALLDGVQDGKDFMYKDYEMVASPDAVPRFGFLDLWRMCWQQFCYETSQICNATTRMSSFFPLIRLLSQVSKNLSLAKPCSHQSPSSMKASYLILVALALIPSAVEGKVIINEIADKGTSMNICEGNDWIELYNNGNEAISLENYRLHDDKGVSHEETFEFPSEMVLEAESYMLLCTEMTPTSIERAVEAPFLSPQFGIGTQDTITLIQVSSAGNSTEESSLAFTLVDQVGPLPGGAESGFGVSYAWNTETEQFEYTSTPTPGMVNILTAPLSPEEQLEEYKQQLKAQNEMGMNFFGMDNSGLPVGEDEFPVVVELHLTMAEENWNYLQQNASHEVYKAFENATIKSPETGEELWSRSAPGRIRPKGQSTLFMGVCLGTKTIPFQLEFNGDQTLFGAEKIYLRHHMADYSYMREWAYHRMLARFGLPHVRTRKALLFVNGEQVGFYTLMEAPDQEYVFARSFPQYNPNNFALYKVKSFALGCGAYAKEESENATIRAKEIESIEVETGERPKYLFERGEHQPPIEKHGLFSSEQCFDDFFSRLWRTWTDAVVAYEDHGEDCGQMLVEEGLVDLDLGTNNYDDSMKDFLNKNFRGDKKCAPGCIDSDLDRDVDVDQVLRTLAFYAALVISDSPIISGNNFYLANSGDGLGWKMVPYDFNQAGIVFCERDVCDARYVHWSIARPTCTSLEEQQLVGPLLLVPEYHEKYLTYAQEFLDTVLTNAELLEQMEAHVNAIAPYVREDSWSIFGANVDKELSPEAAEWTEASFPLLATLEARAKDLQEQFAAIDSGSFPRGPHVGVEGDNEAWEVCADWRAGEANRSACPEECFYVGCHTEGFTIPSFCDEATGKCYHGDQDALCKGIHDDERYPGMEDTQDGRPTFCWFAKGVPVKAAECPAPGVFTETTKASAASPSFAFGAWLLLWSLVGGYLSQKM